MAGSMTGLQQSETRALIGAVRDRLWLQCAVDAGSRDVRLAGAVLLIGGLYHLFVHAIHAGPVVALAVLPRSEASSALRAITHCYSDTWISLTPTRTLFP